MIALPPPLTLSFPLTHPAFAGHFPGHPVVPGVLLLSAAIDALQSASGRRVTQITAAKFLKPVGPGIALTLSFRSGGARVHFDIEAPAFKVASGTLTLAAEAAP